MLAIFHLSIADSYPNMKPFTLIRVIYTPICKPLVRSGWRLSWIYRASVEGFYIPCWACPSGEERFFTTRASPPSSKLCMSWPTQNQLFFNTGVERRRFLCRSWHRATKKGSWRFDPGGQTGHADSPRVRLWHDAILPVFSFICGYKEVNTQRKRVED